MEKGSCGQTHYPVTAGVTPGSCWEPDTPSKGGSSLRLSNNLDPFHENTTPCRAFGQLKAQLGCMGAMLQLPDSFPSHLQGAVAAVQVVQTWREDELIKGTTQRLQRAKRSRVQVLGHQKVPATGSPFQYPFLCPAGAAPSRSIQLPALACPRQRTRAR